MNNAINPSMLACLSQIMQLIMTVPILHIVPTTVKLVAEINPLNKNCEYDIKTPAAHDALKAKIEAVDHSKSLKISCSLVTTPNINTGTTANKFV